MFRSHLCSNHLSTQAGKRVLVWVGWFGLGFFLVVLGGGFGVVWFLGLFSLDDTKPLKF